MLNWFKALFGNKQAPTARANEAAHQELNRLRREQLSIGAQLRRGEPVNSFPGLASGSVLQGKVAATTPAARGSVYSQHCNGLDGDFATSMVVGAATGSALTGYAVGGSLTGAMVGSSLHQDPTGNSTPLSSFDVCSDSSSSTSSPPVGCDF